jgi:flavin-dependent dehydrogenase
VEATVAGRPQRFAARLLVGADGAGSAVARAAGLQMNDARYVLASIRGYCRGLPLDRTILFFEEAFFPGFGWMFPVAPELCNVGVGMVKEPLTKFRIRLKDFYKNLEAFIQAMARRSGVKVEIEPHRGWPIKTYGGARRNYFDRGLLIGEAGCFVDPISGEGIPLAMESAQLALPVVRRAFERGDFSTAVLADFERRWREHWDPDLKVSDLVVSLVRNRHLVDLWMQSFKVMGMTARGDQDYALKTGGILAGLVPNRDGFSADIVGKSLVHGPAFWMEAFDISSHRLAPDALAAGLRLAAWAAGVAQSGLEDAAWCRDWADEVGAKQREVFRLLVTAQLRAPQPPPAWRAGAGWQAAPAARVGAAHA